MNKLFVRFLFIIIFLISTSPFLKAQIHIENSKYIQKIKNDTTFIVLNQVDINDSEIINVFKEYWTFSKLAFILPSEKDLHKFAGNSFFEAKILLDHHPDFSGNTQGSYGREYYFDLNVILKVWNKKNGKKSALYGRVLNINLQYNDSAYTLDLLEPGNVSSRETHPNYKPKDSVSLRYIYLNWKPGFLKNYLQQTMQLLEKGNEVSRYREFLSKEQIGKLKTGTLYIPNYILLKPYFTWYISGSAIKDSVELMQDYKNDYEFISVDDLSDKIMKESEEFYYVIYVKSESEKFIRIINSKTGEIVYAAYKGTSHSVKAKDFKNINKASLKY